MSDKSIGILMLFLAGGLLSACQTPGEAERTLLTNDSVKYWDVYEYPEWNSETKSHYMVKRTGMASTCWAFSINGRWTDYAVNRQGKLRDRNLLAGDTFYENKWWLYGDTLVTGKGGYLVQELTKDTMRLSVLYNPKFFFKLVLSKTQKKEICPTRDCK